MKIKFFFLILLIAVFVGVSFGQNKKSKQGKICGNPMVKCLTGETTFEPYEIPFQIPKTAVIWESEPFYAIILQSSKRNNDENCEDKIPEEQRLEVQGLFPRNKVFAHKCDEPGLLYYTGVKFDTIFLAVYGGKTIAEAKNFLKTVRSTGRFEGAYIKRLRAGFNGT